MAKEVHKIKRKIKKMKINKAYKTELKLNNKEKSLMLQYCGLARFVYNWALDKRIKEYELTKKSSNAIEQHRELNALKQMDFVWMYNYSKTVPQNELRNLDKAFQNFFRRVKSKKGKVGFPKFKSRKKDNKSFRLDGAIKIEHNRIKLPRIGWLRLKESNYIPMEDIKILSATISYHGDKWFVSVQVEKEIQENKKEYAENIGIDLGIKTLAVCSNGEIFENPKALKNNLVKLARIQRKFSRQQKGGKNREKTKLKLQKLYYHISEIRKDTIHKMTTSVVKNNPQTIVIEDLNVSGMLKNRKLSKAISDLGMYEIKRQLEYKCKWNKINLVVADRFFPSSKLCSNCGYKNTELTLANREWVCPICGIKHNRDFNASVNLKNYAVSSTVKVCGENVRHQFFDATFYEAENKQKNLRC
jgi:putative transposase